MSDVYPFWRSRRGFSHVILTLLSGHCWFTWYRLCVCLFLTSDVSSHPYISSEFTQLSVCPPPDDPAAITPLTSPPARLPGTGADRRLVAVLSASPDRPAVASATPAAGAGAQGGQHAGRAAGLPRHTPGEFRR